MSESETSSALRVRVLAAAAATASITRPHGRVVARVLLVTSVALGAMVFEWIGGFAHGSGRPLGVTLTLAGGWTVVSALLTWLVVDRGGSTMARQPLLIGLSVLAMPVVLFAWMHLFNGTYIEPYHAIGYRCLRYTLFIAALPLATFLALHRAVEPRHPEVLGAGAGAACAAWAGGLIDLWCPLTNSMHVLVGHVAPLVAATVLGAVVGRSTLGVRMVQLNS